MWCGPSLAGGTPIICGIRGGRAAVLGGRLGCGFCAGARACARAVPRASGDFVAEFGCALVRVWRPGSVGFAYYFRGLFSVVSCGVWLGFGGGGAGCVGGAFSHECSDSCWGGGPCGAVVGGARVGVRACLGSAGNRRGVGGRAPWQRITKKTLLLRITAVG